MTVTDEPAVRFPPVDFAEFHRTVLPGRLAAGNGALAADDVAEVGALGVAVQGCDDRFTYVPVPGGIEVVAGDEQARTVVELDAEAFSGLVHDLETAPGLLYRDRVRLVRGNPMRLVRWEAAIRAMYHGRPIFDTSEPVRSLRDGRVLDGAATFTLDSDPAEMADFLASAGYLVVKGVFSRDETAAMRAAADRLRALATEGDQKSWWGRNAHGEALLTRVLHAGREEVFRDLYRDDRLLRIAALSEYELVPRFGGNAEASSVLWKLPGVTEGLADIPWHRDCGMGGHATMCPLLIASVCLTDGSPAAGELRALPGSWKASVNFIDPSDPAAPAGVGLAVEEGDVSFHYSDVMHASLAPTSDEGPFRISALVAFVPPTASVHHGDEKTYNDPLLKNPDGQVEHLSKVVDRL
jgi:ectoine hydroxylase-related dioxygenase (phytanoyl-CoA dioxygenase family)